MIILHRPMSRKRGFSLVELLIVVGIIAMLIAILLPLLHRARESAKAIQCASNLRQLGIAFNAYATNNKGYLPGWSGWQSYPEGKYPPDGNQDSRGLGWTEQLAPYYVPPDSAAYTCPSFPHDPQITYFLSCRHATARGERNIRLSSIRLSTMFVLSGDCTQPILYNQPFGTMTYPHDNCDKDDATQEGIVFFGDPTQSGRNMHRGGNNVLFADFHVLIYRKFDPNRMTYHPRKMQRWADVTAE